MQIDKILAAVLVSSTVAVYNYDMKFIGDKLSINNEKVKLDEVNLSVSNNEFIQ